jgi:hypothetical protein
LFSKSEHSPAGRTFWKKEAARGTRHRIQEATKLLKIADGWEAGHWDVPRINFGRSSKKPDGNHDMVARVILEVERMRARRAHGVGSDIFRKETEAGRTPSYRASAIFGGKQKGGVRMRFRGGGKGGLYTWEAGRQDINIATQGFLRGAKTMSLLVTRFRREAKKRKQDIQRRNRCDWKKHRKTGEHALPNSDFWEDPKAATQDM